MKHTLKITVLFLLAAFFTAGCGKMNADKNTKTETKESISEITQTSKPTEENSPTLSITGVPNEEGFYSIDTPGNADDLPSLEQINDRLHFVSAMMAKTGTKSFNGSVGGELYWQTMKQEAAFTIGEMAVLGGDNKSMATISKEDFSRLSELCFGIKPDFQSVSTCFVQNKDSLSFDTSTNIKGAYGFVIKEYKHEGNKWFIRGDIMSSGEKVFTTGVFTLEENNPEDLISHRILEFKEDPA